MSIGAAIREKLRVRANFASKYCGVSEISTAGLLTIDHVLPKSQGGKDSLANLVYCCHSCNEFKGAYYPKSSVQLPLWNPRIESSETHFLELIDGRIHSLTDIGEFTIRRLRLNRLQLIAYRLKMRQEQTEKRAMLFQSEIIDMLKRLLDNELILMEDRMLLMSRLMRVLDTLEKEGS